MVSPVLDYCDAVWHDCGQGNNDKKDYKDEQRGLSSSKLPQNYQLIKLEPFYYRKRTHILRFVNQCIANKVPRYPFNYFNVRNHDIHRH